MNRRSLSLALLVLSGLAPSSSRAAAAPEVAAQPPRASREERWPLDGVLQLAGGLAWAGGVRDGGYGRAEFGPRLHDHRSGPLLHTTVGLEAWRAGSDGGGAIPVTAQIGYVAPPLYVAAGLGMNFLTVDRVQGDKGIGMFSPVAMANAGLTFGRVSVLADARAQYRWQLGASDRRMLMAGLALDIAF